MPAQSDLHIHTHASHGQNSVEEMFHAGLRNGLTLLGFSEHSPRPQGYDYPQEYREHLEESFPEYVREVRRIADMYRGRITVLLGMEVDWISAEPAFIKHAIQAYEFDYLLGSVHFLDHWGFDADARDWSCRTFQEKSRLYTRYFTAICEMARTAWFNIAAHLDIIKIFSVEDFTRWTEQAENMQEITDALIAIRDAGMSLEVSSAGLRKPCREIYPCPRIMRRAAEIGIPISFGADGHCVNTIANELQTLQDYAASFGYTQSVWFRKQQRFYLDF